jgi:hypothetical protein
MENVEAEGKAAAEKDRQGEEVRKQKEENIGGI